MEVLLPQDLRSNNELKIDDEDIEDDEDDEDDML